MSNDECTYLPLQEACVKLGLTYATARLYVHQGKFPVPTFKVGRTRVVDKAVLDEYFMQHRRAGLQQLASQAK